MIDSEEIYRRCHNHYGMEKDEIDTLVLKGKDYDQLITDEEKLNAFYSDLLEANKVSLEDSVEDKNVVPKDDRTLDDNDNIRVADIRKRLKGKRKAQQSMDEEAFEEAGSHLAPEERGTYKNYQELMAELNKIDEDTDAGDED